MSEPKQTIHLNAESKALGKDVHLRNNTADERARVDDFIKDSRDARGTNRGYSTTMLHSGKLQATIGNRSTAPVETVEELRTEVEKLRTAMSEKHETREFRQSQNGTLVKKSKFEIESFDREQSEQAKREQEIADRQALAKETAAALHQKELERLSLLGDVDSGMANVLQRDVAAARAAKDMKISAALQRLQAVSLDPDSSEIERRQAREHFYLSHF